MGYPRVMQPQLAFLMCALKDGCLPWQGALDASGYARTTKDGQVVSAHRLAYELFVGQIPEEYELHHTCGTRSCVNPAHLVPLSRNDHIRHHRLQYGDTCKWGHVLTPENTRLRTRGGTLVCKECQARRSRELNARRRAGMREAL